MTCLNLERLSSYSEGELTGPEKRAVEEHLASCLKCREAVEERRLLIQAARTLPPFEVPSDFAQKIMARISPAPARLTVLGWLAAAAAGVTALVATLGLAALLTGAGFSQLFLGLNRFLWNNIQNIASVLVKVTKYIFLVFKILGQISRELIGWFKVLTSFIGPEAQIILVCLALVIIFCGGILWSRKFSVEKNHEK